MKPRVLVLATTVAFVGLAGQAFAQCHVGGTWSLVQSNGFRVNMNVIQSGKGKLKGTATARGMGGRANIRGSVNGGRLDFEVLWANGSIGEYSAGIDRTFVAKGTSYDYVNPGATANWHSLSTFDCD